MKVRIRFVKKKLSIVLGLIIVAVTFFTLTNQKTVSANSSRVETVSYQLLKEGVADVRLTYYHNKGSDKVLKQTAESKILYSALKVTDAQVAKEKVGSQSEKYQGITGVQESVAYKDVYLIEKVSVDYTKANLNELAKKLPEVNINTPSGKRATYISLKQSERFLKKQGYSKVKNGHFKELKVN